METFARVYDIYAPHLYTHHLSMIQNDFPQVQEARAVSDALLTGAHLTGPREMDWVNLE